MTCFYDKATNKQFITVQTSGGNTFYIVIDYDKPTDEDGEQYQTYFLNMVDEADLLAAMQAAGGELPECACADKCAVGAINTDCTVCAVNMGECQGKAPEPVPVVEPEPEPEPEQSKNSGGTLLLVLAVAGDILLAVVLHWFLTRTRAGLNLRAVGENPATADAAGINVTLYKYLSTCIGAGICGIGGLYYVLDYNQGIWATTGQIEALGWLAVALVIFTTWKPLNAIWGAYLFGMLYWLYQFLPSLLGITLASYMTDLVQMLPYVVTIVVLIVVSMRKKKENQPPAHLGLAYFREER